MIKKIAGKRNRGGYTLAETLMAVMIVVMVAGVVAAGIPVASQALHEAVDASHAQLLLSTTMTSLRDELSMAKDIQCEEGGRIVYTDSSGVLTEIAVKPGGIYMKKFASPDGSFEDAVTEERRLVSDQAATEGLHETFEGSSYDAARGIVSIKNLRVCRGTGSDENELAKLDDVAYEIEIIAKKGE